MAGSKKFCKDTRTNRKTDKRDEGSVWLQSLGAPIDIFFVSMVAKSKGLADGQQLQVWGKADFRDRLSIT